MNTNDWKIGIGSAKDTHLDTEPNNSYPGWKYTQVSYRNINVWSGKIM